MATGDPILEILRRREAVAPFVDTAIAAADAHKDALGFFPAPVFREFAHRELLFVAIDAAKKERVYAGHLLFDCRFPKAHILQMLVSPAYRRVGIAKALLDQLKKSLTDQGFIAIYARVAEDLKVANDFWTSQEFYVQAEKKGGSVRNRKILVRSHELVTPQLFPRSGLSDANPLGLIAYEPDDCPIFLLDLNVLFDLGPRRPRNEEVVSLFKAERAGTCTLAISTEINEELKRTATSGRTDPMRDYAKILPAFSFVENESSKDLINELAQIVFSKQLQSASLNANEESDLRHLATVVQHQLAGLITSDNAVLDAASVLAGRYGIQVLSPLAFSASRSSTQAERTYATASTEVLELTPIKDVDLPLVQTLLSGLSLSTKTIVSGWAPTVQGDRSAIRYGAWSGRKLVGYLTWPAWSKGNIFSAKVAIDEGNVSARMVAQILLRHLLDQRPEAEIAHFAIELAPKQAYLREIAWMLGFRGASQRDTLTKITLRKVITPTTWARCRGLLSEAEQLTLPDRPPVFRCIDQRIWLTTPNGNRSQISIEAMETLLAPTLLCLPERKTVISPINRQYSVPLLGYTAQHSLLPQSKASIHAERRYFSDPKTLKHFDRGSIILFYESKKNDGCGCIVALARVRHAYLKPQEAIEAADLDPSVLDEQSLKRIGTSDIKAVTTFDNVMPFANPVPLSTLQRIGCGRPNDLISTRPISDEQSTIIFVEGFPGD